jgi:hypothetical protein
MLASRSERYYLVLLGCALARLGTAWLTLSLGHYTIHPANIAVVALAVWFPVRHANPWFSRLWYVMLGIALDGMVFLIIKSSYGYYSSPAIYGAAALLAIYILASVSIRSPISQDFDDVHPRVMLLCAAIIILVLRLVDFAIAEIPNEARSLFIGGFEIHHINGGVVGLILLDHLRRPRSPFLRSIHDIAAGTAMGSVLDQGLYYALSEVSDVAYREPASLIGALAGLGAGVALCVGRRASTYKVINH